MQLERLAVELRPRTNWEAVDLGATMVRAWWTRLYVPWLLVVLPLSGLLLWWLGGWGLLLLWWLKPVLDRLPLHVLSRGVFGDLPRVRQTLRDAPRLLSGFLFDALLFWRLDVARSFHLPTWQLEGLRGSQRRQRASVLDRDSSGVAGGLTVVCLLFEWGFCAALLLLGPFVTPSWLDLDWSAAFEALLAGEPPGWLRVYLLAAPVLAFSFLEPFYVAAGFSLYLNRRTRLEGWDLEIAFRRLAARAREREKARLAVERRARTQRSLGVGVALLALLLGALAAPAASRAQADENDGDEPPRATREWSGAADRDPRELIRQVLAEPTFEREKTVDEWQLRDDLFPDTFEAEEEKKRTTVIGPALAMLLKALIVAVAIALIGFLVFKGLQALGWIRLRKRTGAEQPPRIVAGLDISPESLPDDPASEAERAWREGRRAEALSLLYRASLATLVTRDAVPLRESDTEDDCLVAARSVIAPSRSDYLHRLTRGWLSTAYAHRPPRDEVALPLIRDWPEHFGEAA